MKNTKLTKILVLALSLALLIGAAIGFSVSANEEETLTIVSQNVSYEGQTHLYYAVYYENVEFPEKIALEVSYTDDEGVLQNVTVNKSEEVTLKDSSGADFVCRAFRTPGVSAKNFTKVFTVKAVTESGTESAEKTYSVAEYCHQWLYDIANVAEPTEKQLKIKAACETTLSYGTDVQALLDYYPAGNTEDYPENYSYIAVENGTANGKAKLFTINGTEVTLAANAGAPAAWAVTAIDGTESQLTENTFTAAGSCTISPINGKFFSDANYTGTRIDFNDGTKGATIFEGGNGTYTNSTVVDGALRFERIKDTEGEGYNRWNVSASAGKNIYVFESDIRFSGFTNGTSVGKMRFQLAGIDEQITISHSGDTITFTCATTNAIGSVSIAENQWCNLRFELDTTTRTFNIFVNNSHAGTITSPGTATTTSSRLLFYILKSGYDGVVEFDNIFSGMVAEGTAIPAN